MGRYRRPPELPGRAGPPSRGAHGVGRARSGPAGNRGPAAGAGTLDAIHLATEFRLAEAGELDALMTYDKHLFDAAREHGLTVLRKADAVRWLSRAPPALCRDFVLR
jgi:hypothetical protein